MSYDITTFEYNEVEWDNIPQIIPKYLNSTSKQFNNMIRWQSDKDRLESATEVKEELSTRITENNFLISKLQNWSVEYSLNVTDKVEGLQEVDKDLDERLTYFYIKLEKEEIFDINDFITDKKDYDTEEEENEYLNPEDSTPNYDKSKAELRFWSLDQLKMLFFRLLKGSKVRKRQSKYKRQIEDLRQKTLATDGRINVMHQNYLDSMDKLEAKISANNENLINEMETQQLKIQHLYDNIEQINYRFKQLEKRCDDNEVQIKGLMQYTDKMNSKINYTDLLIKEKTESIKADLYDMQTKAQTRFDKAQKNLSKDMDDYRKDNTQKIDQSREYIKQELISSEDNIKNLLEDFKILQMQSFAKDLSGLNQKINNIENLLEKIEYDYNHNDELLEEKIILNTSTLSDYNNKFIKPSKEVEEKVESIHDRVLDLDYQIHSNVNVIRDIIKKLIYTMETSLITGKSIDRVQKEKSYMNGNESFFSIWSPRTQSKQPDTSEQAKEEYEKIFLMRLNFLKNLLDENVVNEKFNQNKSNYSFIDSGRIIFNNTPKRVSDLKNRSFSQAEIPEMDGSMSTYREGSATTQPLLKSKFKSKEDQINLFHKMKLIKSENDSEKLYLPKVGKK